MPGLMGRATVIVKAKFSKLLDRAEDPGETLDYSYEEQLRQLQNVKRGIADVTTAKKRLELQYASMQQQADKLDGQARTALQQTREDLAREALSRKAALQGQLEGIMQQGQQLEAQQQKLIEGEKTLQAKVESFRTQKEVIKAQYSAAEAQVRIGEATTGLSGELGDVGMAVQRAHDKTEQMKARAAAVEELVATGALDDVSAPGSTELDRQLAAMSADAQIESEMAKLRAEVEAPGAAPELTEAGAEEPAPRQSTAPEAEPSTSPEDPSRP